DALGRRVARSEAGNNVVYVHAGQQVIADYARGAAAAAPSFRYVYGSYVDEPLLRHAGTGTTLPPSGTAALYYHRNQQYSIVGLSDAAGTLVERYAYTAYGELTILAPDRTLRPTSSFENRYTYTGREWDPALRLYHFRARWLEPKAGRFIGRDPLGYVDGMGLYGFYASTNRTDPSGMDGILAGDLLDAYTLSQEFISFGASHVMAYCDLTDQVTRASDLNLFSDFCRCGEIWLYTDQRDLRAIFDWADSHWAHLFVESPNLLQAKNRRDFLLASGIIRPKDQRLFFDYSTGKGSRSDTVPPKIHKFIPDSQIKLDVGGLGRSPGYINLNGASVGDGAQGNAKKGKPVPYWLPLSDSTSDFDLKTNTVEQMRFENTGPYYSGGEVRRVLIPDGLLTVITSDNAKAKSLFDKAFNSPNFQVVQDWNEYPSQLGFMAWKSWSSAD
ncbi:MAG: RHS repeat-associated core domain-containing protein, partial [Planctomycetota bacterium]